MIRESRPPLEGTCPAVAYQKRISSMFFRCDLPPDHDGRHECKVAPETTVSWPVDMEFTIAPLRPPLPPQAPFDRSREQWFSGTCVHPGCYGDLTGRSLDGTPAHWWHDISVLDNDHDADPGDRKEAR